MKTFGKYKIRYVGKKSLKDFDGMNHYAGKKFGYKIDDKNEIHIIRGLSKEQQIKTIKHEIVEIEHMKRGYSYWKSHSVALKEENKPIRLSSGRYVRF